MKESSSSRVSKRLLVALSGGVDSAVAAARLQAEGHDLVAAYMKNWINEDDIFGDCPWQQDIEDARAVSEYLGLEFRVVNLMDDYRERVVKYLLEGYQSGVTPNPDVMCNREIKFGVFLDYALENGFEGVATGHYARTRKNVDGRTDLLEGRDPNKDQTYFLALMNQRQVAHAYFPVGGLLKSELRGEAEALGLPNASKKDSQGICFIGQIKMADFLREYVPDKVGLIVNQEGERLGEHQGLHYYTLGQRKGIGVASPVYKENYVVVEKRGETDELVVAFDRSDTDRLYARCCRIHSMSYVNRSVECGVEILARPRYRAPAQKVRFRDEGEGTAVVEFDVAQRALAPGQICALYDGEVLLGGGIFSEILYD